MIGITTMQSCSKRQIVPKNTRNKVHLRFKNTGESKIEKLVFNGQKIGNIKAGSTTKYFVFNKLELGEHNQIITEVSTYVSEYDYTAEHNTTYMDVISTKTTSIYTINIDVYMSCGVGFHMMLAE